MLASHIAAAMLASYAASGGLGAPAAGARTLSEQAAPAWGGAAMLAAAGALARGGLGEHAPLALPWLTPAALAGLDPWRSPASSLRAEPAGEPAPPVRGTLSESFPLSSAALGYVVNVRVYEPPPTGVCQPLPVVYVTDGSDYWKTELGNVVDTLDELITSGRMSPVIAVFIDAWDPAERRNRRYEQFLPAGTETREPFEACPFCDFIAYEVVPWTEERYAVDAERRGILGSSLGGFNAAYMALTRPDLFHVVGIQSPSVWRQPWLAPRIAAAPMPPARVAIDVGVDEPTFLAGARALRDAYVARGVTLQYREAALDHSWAHWRATAGEVLQFLYAPR